MTGEIRTHDLRRRALESHKTVSKKAKARSASSIASSPAGSRPLSHASSRNASRAPSDVDSDDSEATDFGNHSIEEVLDVDDIIEDGTDAWRQILRDRIDEIIERKRSTVEGRKLAYSKYIFILTNYFADKDVEPKVSQLLPALIKSFKQNDEEREMYLAIRAVEITLATCPQNSAYIALEKELKNLYTSADTPSLVKAAAIHALGTILVYGGAGDEEIENVLDELLEIASSDGVSIEADDDPTVVAAAIETWGYLATFVDDLEEKSEDAIETFKDQLGSAYTSVQMAAGSNIALLYERSWTDREEDDAPAEDAEDEEGFPIDNSLVKRYDPFRQINQLKHELTQLASISSKGVSRKDRTKLHKHFSDVLNTVEHPYRGPDYQNAIDQETGNRYGSRMKVKVKDAGVMRIDRWWKLMRLNEFRRVLGGGFLVHYEKNDVVFNNLPIMITPN